MATLRALVALGRPHYLVGGLAFFALGIVLAQRFGGALDAWTVSLSLLVVLFTQWGVHYHNELHDLAVDRANAQRTRVSGGSGVLVAGRASPHDARLLATALVGCAGLAAVALAVRAPSTLPVSGALLGLAWGYSAPPLRLCSRGWGELATGLVVAGLVPALLLVPAGVPPLAFAALTPLVLQVTALVVVLSLPDAASDATAGKGTLAVRWGPRRARRTIQVAWLAAGLATTCAIAAGGPPILAASGGAAFAAAVALPVLVFRARWEFLALVAGALVALQWALTVLWALS